MSVVGGGVLTLDLALADGGPMGWGIVGAGVGVGRVSVGCCGWWREAVRSASLASEVMRDS